MNVEQMTVDEFVSAAGRINNSVDENRAFKQINSQLKHLPHVQERLALQLMPVAWQALQCKNDVQALDLVGLAKCFNASIGPKRLEYVTWLERIGFRCFELLEESPKPLPENTRLEFIMSLVFLGLNEIDKRRRDHIFEALKRRCSDPRLSDMRDVLCRIERDS